MYTNIIETSGYNFKRSSTKEEIADIERLRAEMRKRLLER